MSEAQAIIDVLIGQRRSPGQRGGTGEVSASFVADCAVAEHVSQLPQRQSSAKWQHSPTHLQLRIRRVYLQHGSRMEVRDNNPKRIVDVHGGRSSPSDSIGVSGWSPHIG